MTPADQDMDRVVAAQRAVRMDSAEALAWARTVDEVQRVAERESDDKRYLMAQQADVAGRLYQHAAAIEIALLRPDSDELTLREFLATLQSDLEGLAGQPLRALGQLPKGRAA